MDADANKNKLVLQGLQEIKEDVIKLEDENKTLKHQLSVRDELSLDIRRTLHWVLKVGNLKKSLDFFTKVFKMKVLRHEEFGSGCDAKCNGDFDRPWSKTMIAFANGGGEKTNFALELTYNYGIRGYQRGNDLRFIGLNICKQGLEAAQQFGYKCTPCDDSKLFYDIIGPDQVKYRCKVTQKETNLPAEIFWSISLNVQSVEQSFRFWSGTLSMQCIQYIPNKYLRVSYGGGVPMEFYQLPKNTKVDHAKAQGRIAFTTSVPNGPFLIHDHVQYAHGEPYIHTKPVTLKTPGKADVDVVILQDPDEYEICFVNQDGFDDLCTTKPGDDRIDWKKRSENGADSDKGKFIK